jgi:putative restriction endonuclease
MSLDADLAFRLAVFEHVGRLRDANGGVLTAAALNEGIIFQGQRVPMWSQMKGIFRPAILRFPGAALTVFTAYEGPYDDHVDPDQSHFVYRYRGTDPDHPDNIAVRLAYELKRPVLYLVGIQPGVYDAIFPCYVTGDNPAELTFYLMADVADDPRLVGASDSALFEARRAYRTVLAKARLHQQQFRYIVLGAYRHQCAMCRLKHTVLLDAAHILPDSDPRGRAIVTNGLSLCRIHHGAFDVGILGVDPDYKIHLRRDILDEHDGPMLRHGLQEMHGATIHTPRDNAKKPSREFLAERFDHFRAA